jgi:2-polyprenyl-3-methyl-5-hydroxy-6-metoxy-1,4-benzoquinol methylase
MELELLTQCPVCNGKVFESIFKAIDHTTSKEEFQVQRCNNCQFVVTNPRPTIASIGRYYDSEDYISHAGGKASLVDKTYLFARKLTTRQKRNTIEQYQKGGTILDIGCGTGEFLHSFEKAKWKKVGIEPSEKARKKVSKEIALYESISEFNDQVEVITLWHVLEHVHDPNETLTQIKKRLKKNGTLFIAVPNLESYDATHYKNYWAAYDVPRHLSHFSKQTMKFLLEKNGFKLERIQAMPLDSFYVSLLSEKYSNPKSNVIVQAVKAFTIGAISNLNAKKDNYSSLLYIAAL